MQGVLVFAAVALTASACKDKPAVPSQEGLVAAPAFDAAPAAAVPTAPARDFDCPVLGEIPRTGTWGGGVVKPGVEHAGIRSLALGSDEQGRLALAILAEADIDNDRGLTTKENSPARSVQIFRLVNETWQDLGRPFQITGWDSRIELSLGGGPVHVSIEAGIGDVRRALVASCENSAWQEEPRYRSRNVESAALLSVGGTMSNIEIARAPLGVQGPACQPKDGVRGPDMPMRLELQSLVDRKVAPVNLAVPDDCRLARDFRADASASELVVSFQLCKLPTTGEHAPFNDCQLATVHHDGQEWKRMPGLDLAKLGPAQTSHKVALSQAGPLVAAGDDKGVRLLQAEGESWQPLPKLPIKGCQSILALQSDPARIILRSCAGSASITAYLLVDETWQAMASPMRLRPLLGEQELPVSAAHWIDERAYVALGYQGAPVARVFESHAGAWLQVLQTHVDPEPLAGPQR